MPVRIRSTIRLRSTIGRPRGRRCRSASQPNELDVEQVQLIKHFEEVFNERATREESPDRDHIEAPAVGIRIRSSRSSRRALAPEMRSVYSYTIT
jgi:hypothetical protein